jgi:hypothetical protein
MRMIVDIYLAVSTVDVHDDVTLCEAADQRIHGLMSGAR